MKRERCHICGTSMDNFLMDETRKLHVCGNNPDCSGYKIEQGAFKLKGYDGPLLECHKCGAEMQLNTGKFGKYFLCLNDNCKTTRNLQRNGEPKPIVMEPILSELACEKFEDHYLLRDSMKGLFLAASKYPKNRETRAPKLEEFISIVTEDSLMEASIKESSVTIDINSSNLGALVSLFFGYLLAAKKSPFILSLSK